MPRAIFNGKVIAESEDTEIIEGNVYFPPDSIKEQYFQQSAHTTICGWKGMANYYSLSVGGKSAENAAWTYRDPKPEAARIRDFVAFYPIVTVKR